MQRHGAKGRYHVVLLEHEIHSCDVSETDDRTEKREAAVTRES